MRLTLLELYVLSAAGAVLVGVTLQWQHRSSQNLVARNRETTTWIVGRLLMVYAIAAVVLCDWIGVRVVNFLLALPFAYLMACVGANAPLGTTAGEFVIGMMIFLPFLLIREFVLGFPMGEPLCPEPPVVPVNPTPPPRQADEGIVVATLRPMGRIQIGDEQFDAASFDGNWVEVNEAVQVCGQRGTVYLVQPHSQTDSNMLSKATDPSS